MLLSDRIKSDLNEACLRHIVGLESVIGDDGWIEPKRLAGIIDDYVANVGFALHPMAMSVGQPKNSRRTNVPVVSVKTDKTDKNCSDPEKPEKKQILVILNPALIMVNQKLVADVHVIIVGLTFT